MEEKHRVKTGGAGLGAICALALVCVWGLAGSAFAQASPSSNTASSGGSSGTKTSSTKTSSTKSAATTPHAKTSAAGMGTTSKTKAHPAAGTHPKSNTATVAHNSKAKRASARSKKKTTARGQQKIDPERAQAIQEALIREHYLSGEAAGTWNQASEDAMRKYQADHGWQSKTVPDSRALISLGLGPSHDHLLNPESAMTTGPEALHSASMNSTSPNSASPSPVSHSAEPGTRVSTTPADPAPATTSGHDGTSPQ